MRVKTKYVQWILFGCAFIAILGLAASNIYYIDKVNSNNRTLLLDEKTRKVSDFTNEVRNRLLLVPRQIWNLDLNQLGSNLRNDQSFPEEFVDVVQSTVNDPMYSSAYFYVGQKVQCNISNRFFEFNPEKGDFQPINEVRDIVCDGLSLSETRMKVIVDDYKWKTKTVFDTHRSMNIAIMDVDSHTLMGYLVVIINTDYFLNTYLKEEIARTFGSEEDASVQIWIRDWVKGEVLLSNVSNVPYDSQSVQIAESFPGLLDNWNIRGVVVFNESLSGMEAFGAIGIISVASMVLLVSLMVIIITAQKQRELAVQQASFLSNVTHELKTPLAVIQAAGENLKDGRVSQPNRIHYYGKHIFEESQRLRFMIEKLLDVARAANNKLVAHPAIIATDEIIRSISAKNEQLLESNAFQLKISNDIPTVSVELDLQHLHTIMTNLLENAIKYKRDKKVIELSFRTKSNMLVIDVKDFGVGIPKKYQQKIFEKFYRVEDVLTAHTKGHGLGLSIVKNLVELNNGTISVQSTSNVGSTFTLKFPIIEVPKSQEIESKPLNKSEYSEETYTV